MWQKLGHAGDGMGRYAGQDVLEPGEGIHSGLVARCDEASQHSCRQGLGFVPLPGFGEGVASMQALLSDSSTPGRASAALLLGKDRDPATVAALRDALYDKDWHVRAAAVHAVALQNDPAFKPDLNRVTLDDKEEVRLRAAAGWLRLNAIETRRARKVAAAAGK